MATFKCFPARRLKGWHEKVEILCVKNPSRVYVHLDDPDGTRAKLLKYFAATSLTHPEVHPVVEEETYEGAPVYVKCDDRLYRGVVEKEQDEEGDILVWLGDWAMTLITNMQEMYTVPQAHKTVPFQAVACGMHHTRPRTPGFWEEEAVKLSKSILEEGSSWYMYIHDRDTGSDAVWVEFLPESLEETSPREKLIGAGMAHEGANPGWFDWGEDAAFHCDQTQLPYHYRVSRGPGRDMSDSESDEWVDPRDAMEMEIDIDEENEEETGEEEPRRESEGIEENGNFPNDEEGTGYESEGEEEDETRSEDSYL